MNPAGGDWDTGANWSTGTVPTASDDVVIEVAGGVTITHSQNDTDSVNSITASDPITLSGGSLTVTGAFSDTSAVTLSDCTLANATVQAGTTINISGGPGSTGTLEDVTLAGTLNVNNWSVSVAGAGLTLANGTIDIGGRDLIFSGTQTLGVFPGDTGDGRDDQLRRGH